MASCLLGWLPMVAGKDIAYEWFRSMISVKDL